jgi:catechol 2,3-dioxygenase-like lactoylglutathione lyase family enzyme
MLQLHKVMAFVATRDGRRAREFYEGILGLQVVSDDPYALALDARGTQIRVQKVTAYTPHPFTALGWEVSSIDDAVEALRARGVSFEMFSGMGQDAKGIWQAPSGARVAWFKDPDGNTLSLTQP